MAQQCVERMKEELAPTISQRNTQEMCFMALEADSNHHVGEGQSTVRPPLFVRENYTYWKIMMKLFIQTSDYEVWRIILNNLIIPTKKVGDQDVVKQEEEWDANDLKLAQLNAKAMHTLFCALGASEYNRVSLCENAKEVWDKLQVTHEGTNHVKETKIGMLTHEYELSQWNRKKPSPIYTIVSLPLSTT